jgi:hydroxyacylglutathione hydrolase
MTLVQILPVLKDNYSYFLCEINLKKVLAVDPVVPDAIVKGLKDLGPDWKLDGILTTHHHWDHSGGNIDLLSKYPDLKVYGGDERIPGLNQFVRDRQVFKFGSMDIIPIATPCHTSGSISYFVDSKPPIVFTGDTLFMGGCGRFFEGTAKDMYNALIKELGSLPDDTLVYPGHEYTKKNLQFAMTVDAQNKVLLQEFEKVKSLKVTIPSSIKLEKEINPFMRVELLKGSLGLHDGIDAMRELRQMKDDF